MGLPDFNDDDDFFMDEDFVDQVDAIVSSQENSNADIVTRNNRKTSNISNPINFESDDEDSSDLIIPSRLNTTNSTLSLFNKASASKNNTSLLQSKNQDKPKENFSIFNKPTNKRTKDNFSHSNAPVENSGGDRPKVSSSYSNVKSNIEVVDLEDDSLPMDFDEEMLAEHEEFQFEVAQTTDERRKESNCSSLNVSFTKLSEKSNIKYSNCPQETIGENSKSNSVHRNSINSTKDNKSTSFSKTFNANNTSGDEIPAPIHIVDDEDEDLSQWNLMDEDFADAGEDRNLQEPFVYLASIPHLLGEDGGGEFVVRAFISTLAGKLQPVNDKWDLPVKINDGSATVDGMMDNQVSYGIMKVSIKQLLC